MAATFHDVNPGEPWTPEPAARYNAVNRLVNRLDDGGAGIAPRLPAQRGALVVQAVAASGAAIPAYAPVVLSGAVIGQNPGDPADAVFRVAGVASGGALMWGVTQSPVAAAGGIVPVLLGGLTAVTAAGAVTAGDPLTVGAGGVVSGAGAARALTTGASGGIILAQLGAGGAAAPGYSGYFTLSIASGSAGYAVTIADGATGGASTAVVNGGRVWSVAPYTEAVAGDRLFFLKFTPPEYDQYGAVTVPESLVIASLGPSGGVFPVLPDGGADGAYYMQLGRLLWNSGAPRVVQDHTAGVAEFNWFVRCDRFTS